MVLNQFYLNEIFVKFTLDHPKFTNVYFKRKVQVCSPDKVKNVFQTLHFNIDRATTNIKVFKCYISGEEWKFN